MRIIILNWSEGENDPFTFFSQSWQKSLQGEGHEVHIVPLDVRTILTVSELQQERPIDLAFTWQGLGSDYTPDGFDQTLWELLQIPLVCLHGDHPSYNPRNHQQTSRFVVHIYGEAIFADAANRSIAREWPALYGLYPYLFAYEPPQREFVGDYFVFAKNIQELADIRAEWQARYDAPSAAMLMEVAAAIEAAYFDGNRINHHEIILQYTPAPVREQLRSGHPSPEAVEYHSRFSRELDRVHRNVAAAFVLDALPHVPIHIYGRGWDRFKARGNPMHQFFPAETVAQSEHQYFSNYGILDVASSNDMLHDRTFRAMHLRSGFLISSSWKHHALLHETYADLFFGGDATDLARKVEIVRNDPAAHRARCAAFHSHHQPEPRVTALFLDQIGALLAARGIR